MIHNANLFKVPRTITPGGRLGGATQWHFAAVRQNWTGAGRILSRGHRDVAHKADTQ
jgi:hypothetical protein